MRAPRARARAWKKLFLDEVEAFPDSKYKDQVDSLSGAFNKISAKPEPAFIFG